MAEITTTQSFSDGDTVTATKLNNIQANASVQPDAITNRTAETTIDQANDLLLIYDASATALKKVSASNLIKAGTASDFPITGNATIGGTLGVTGNSTLSGTLGVTGNSTLSGTLGVAGTSALTGNTTIGGTLGVTGAITATSTINGTTIPATKTLVTTVDTQTITNKTLTSPSISTPTITGQITASTSVIDIGSGQIYKDASGNVGVGTASPSVKLDVSGGNIRGKEILLENGAASSPALGTTPSWYSPASGVAALSTNANERLRIDSSGNVGIGGTPSTLLHLQATSPSLRIQAASGNSGALDFYRTASVNSGQIASESTNALVFSTNTSTNSALTERLRIDSSGRVGIGATSPLKELQINATEPTIRLEESGAGSKRLELSVNSSAEAKIFATQSGTVLLLGTVGTERLRITSGGYLKASNTGTYVNSAAAFHEIRSDSSGNEALVLSNSATTAPYGMQIRFTATPNDATSTFLACIDGNGTTTRADLRSNGGFRNYQANDANLSDERLKKDIIASPNYLEKICSIPVVNFKYKDQTHDDYNLGVIAQQLEAVCPELVDADGFGETPADGIPIKTIYQTDLQYALMKCIQELSAKVTALEAA